MKNARTVAVLLIVALGIGAPAGSLARAQTTGQPIRMTAWAVSMGTVATGANETIEVWVDKWSTDKEREQLIATFLDKGQDGLLKALQKVPVKGRIRVPNRRGPDPTQTRLGWDLRFAMETPGEDGGRRRPQGSRCDDR